MIENSPFTVPAKPVTLLGRQPIVDRAGAVAGYELLHRSGPKNVADILDDELATQEVIINTLCEFGIAAVLGPHRGFLNVGRASLCSDVLSMLPASRFTLELLESVDLDDEVRAHARRLRKTGFQIALDDVVSLKRIPSNVLSWTNIVKIDLRDTPRGNVASLVEAAHESHCLALAEKVETRSEYTEMLSLGVDLFQGYFFAKPDILVQNRSTASKSSILDLLNILASEPTIGRLELAVKRSPLLLAQLIRLANSASCGAGTPATVREAIVRVGTHRISRWAQILLYAEDSAVPLEDNPLVQLAATRARFMELTAQRVLPNDAACSDGAFQTGIFSLMHTVIGQTQDQLMSQLSLREPVRAALVNKTGFLGDLLNLAELMECFSGCATIETPLLADLSDSEIMALYSNAIADVNAAIMK